MRQIDLLEQHIISAGCDNESCKDITLALLETCDFAQMHQVNSLFKSIMLSDQMKGVDSDTLKAALVTAIQNADF